MIDPTGHSMQSLKNQIDGLKKQRKSRITMRDNYAKNRWNYDEGSKMFELLTDGWQRNRKIVKDLNHQIISLEGQLEELKDKMSGLIKEVGDRNETSDGIPDGLQIDNSSANATEVKAKYEDTYTYSNEMANVINEKYGDNFSQKTTVNALTIEIYSHVRVFNLCKPYVIYEHGVIIGEPKYADMIKSTENIDIGYKEDDTLGYARALDSWGSISLSNNQQLCEMAAEAYFMKQVLF